LGQAGWPPPSRPSGPPGLVGTPVYYTQVAPKNPAVAVLASFFMPGLGSMINGDVAKGIGILIGYFVSWLFVIVLVGIVGVFGFWVWGMVDAYQGARRWNAAHGILS
jgi:TM2 domain-containing membrane protein YozV